MLYTKLCVPLVLKTNVNAYVNICPKADKEQIEGLADLTYSIHIGSPEKKVKFSVIPTFSDTDLQGGNAVAYYCREYCGTDDVIPVYSEINIPNDVYYRCTGRKWLEICKYTAAVDYENNRLENLDKASCANEYIRVYNSLRDAVEELVLYLDLIGYSLLDGWSDKKLLEFAELDETQEEKK